MKYKSTNFIFIILVLTCFYSAAQTSNIDFTITSNSSTISGVNVDISSTITKSGNTLTWLQQANNGNSDLSIFNIINSIGTWDEVDSIGNITYNLNEDGHNYSMVLSNEGSRIRAVLTYHKNEEEETSYVVHINTFTYQ